MTGPAADQDPGTGRLAIRARERHAAIHDLLAQGKNYTQISQMLGLARHTVRKFARAATAEQVITGPSPRPSRLDRFAPLPARALGPGMHRRRSAVHRDPGPGLLRQQALSAPLPAAAARRAHRPGDPAAPADRPGGDPVDHQPPRPPHRRRDSPAQPGQSPQPASERHRWPRHRVRRDDDCHHGERLPAWITAVDLDDVPCLHSFTRGIRRDQAAVLNGLTLAHSSGAVEGNVCRIKALKRQMFGRASLDLLRKRILLST